MSTMTKPITPDRICHHYVKKDVGLTVRPLKEEEDMILIEGNRESLEFLGRLILSMAAFHDCGFDISPHSAGKRFFTEAATLGIYIHRLPCTHPDNGNAKP
jgi:hypothetical protein